MWREVPGNGRIADGPAAVVFEHRLWLVARSDDGAVWAQCTGKATGWASGWRKIGREGTLASGPAAAVIEDTLYLFGRGPDGSVQMLYRSAGEEWPDPDA